MAELELRCPKCGSLMEQGFLVDVIYPGTILSQPQADSLTWAKGAAPDLSRVGVLSKLGGDYGFEVGNLERKPVQSLRCSGCGYLELYAR